MSNITADDLVDDEIATFERKTAGAGSSRKVLQILFSFSEQRRSATVAELASIIGAPVPTVYRHVALLKELQLLEEGSAGRYHPTARVMPLARAAQLSNDLARIGAPIVAETSREVRETVMLMQYFGDSVVCIELTECDRPMRFVFQRGHSMAMGVGASGKMALAGLPAEPRSMWLNRLELTRPGLRAEIDRVNDQQFATSKSELDEGVWACSVPVLVELGRPVVLTAAGPSARISEAAKDAALDLLRVNAARIRDEVARYSL